MNTTKLAELIRPRDDMVLVLRDEKEETTKGGIVLPDEVAEGRNDLATGTVIAVGPGKQRYREDRADFIRDPLDISVDDRVMYSRQAGLRVTDMARKVLDIDQKDAERIRLFPAHQCVAILNRQTE